MESQAWTQPQSSVSSISSRFSLLVGTDCHLLHSLLTSKIQGCFRSVLLDNLAPQNQLTEKHPSGLKCLSYTHQDISVSNKIPGWKSCRLVFWGNKKTDSKLTSAVCFYHCTILVIPYLHA